MCGLTQLIRVSFGKTFCLATSVIFKFGKFIFAQRVLVLLSNYSVFTRYGLYTADKVKTLGLQLLAQ